MYEQHFQDFKRLAESTWTGLRVEGLEEGSGRDGRTIALMIRDGDFSAEVAWMGHGLQMWLQTMWFLARSTEIGTVILDEPDVYMHPDLQRKLFRLVKGRFAQTIIATHSVEIMAEADPTNILVIDKARRRSEYANSDPGVQHLIDNIGSVHNVHLARLWNARRLLWVEGKDVSLLRHFHLLIWPETDAPLDAIPNMAIGGWGGWNYAVHSSMFVRNALGDRVVAYCVLDRDYHTEDEIQARLADATSRGIRLHIWSLKEIENYLLNPSVIARVISRRLGTGRRVPEPSEIEEQFDQIAEQLKAAAVDAIADHYSTTQRHLTAGAAHRKARESVEARWSERTERLAIISGKDALSLLSDWSRTQYAVSFGVPAVWRAFRRDEVPHEIVRVLRSIEDSSPIDE